MATKTCISPEENKLIKKAVADGEFSLGKIKETKSSSERFDLVDQYLANPELSKKVVREIEKRLTSKRETIVEDYITRTFTDVPENTRKGVFNKFKRMSQFLGAKEEKDFLEELVAHKFGAYISKEQANTFEKLTNEAILLKEKGIFEATSENPVTYGDKIVELENAEAVVYMGSAGFKFSGYQKLKGQKGGELIANWSKYLATAAAEASGATRAFKASSDVSAIFRQNWKIFSSAMVEVGYNKITGKSPNQNFKYKIWRNTLTNTLKAIKETSKYGDHRFYDSVRAEIHNHPNSYNGIFDAATNSYGLRAGVEEQFPSSIPSDIYDKYVSKKTNIFKISEVAFNAVVLKSRFELANQTIGILKESKLNLMDKKYADPAGEFVSAFTGRGGLGSLEKGATLFNKIFFAPKYAASQFSPYFQLLKGVTSGADNKAARFAAEQNFQFLLGSAALMLSAETMRSFVMGDEPDYTSVINPLSNTFGKVKVFGLDRSIDFTGGNRSVWGLMTGLFATKYYDSRLGIWRKKNFFQTADGKAYYDFASSKYAPVPGVLRDLWKGEQFGGNELPSIFTGDTSLESNGWTALKVTNSLLMPIIAENAIEEFGTKNSTGENYSAAMLVAGSESVGLGASDIRFKPQNDEWKALLNTDKKAYWGAVDELWGNIQDEIKSLRVDPTFQALDDKTQREKIEKMYTRELDSVIKQDQYQNLSKEKLEEIKTKRDEF